VDSESRLHWLGRRIRELRAARGWSQEDFAEVCGVHRTYVGHLERGEKNVSFGTLVRVAEALGVKLSELFKGIEDPSRTLEVATPSKRDKLRGRKPLPMTDVSRLLDELKLQRDALREAVTALDRASVKPTKRKRKA
jgi:transcriptional regulator with XRE-family HTH domain